ncbi:hypothetical protein C8J57DRAFT_1226121 [Mycena rebaudengoi]|nr:hypothetical protein C8J57DRAFT_1232901 [Mycena rebaudengoi]KAJ7271533.1 hypothetical protein C8J57DRAFT_1226121 [Mycena rebaudengoi]
MLYNIKTAVLLAVICLMAATNVSAIVPCGRCAIERRAEDVAGSISGFTVSGYAGLMLCQTWPPVPKSRDRVATRAFPALQFLHRKNISRAGAGQTRVMSGPGNADVSGRMLVGRDGILERCAQSFEPFPIHGLKREELDG